MTELSDAELRALLARTRNDMAAAPAQAAGLAVVQDRCIMVEHRRLR